MATRMLRTMGKTKLGLTIAKKGAIPKDRHGKNRTFSSVILKRITHLLKQKKEGIVREKSPSSAEM